MSKLKFLPKIITYRYKRKYVTTLLVILLSLYIPLSVFSWGNGNPKSFKYPYYGIHDLIADYAYLKLKEYNETMALWISDFYLNPNGSKWGDYGYSFNQGADCWLGYTDDPDSYWRDWNNHLYEVHGYKRGAPRRVLELYNLTVNYLAYWIASGMPYKSQEEHLAVYYAGLLTHYFADMSQFGHTDYTYLDHSHPAYDPLGRTFHAYYESVSITDDLLSKLESDVEDYDFTVDVYISNVCKTVINLARWVNSHNSEYVNLSINHVVINEVELNPPGFDEGNEWVELYNPTNRSVDISGWIVKTTHGVTVSVQIPENTILEPKSHYIVTYYKQWLDNEEEQILLFNDKGELIDSTHKLTDKYNDDRSWQRWPDGYADWRFTSSTKGIKNNGKPKIVGLTYWEMLTKFVSNYDEGISYLGARGYDEQLYEITSIHIKAAIGNLTNILYSIFIDAVNQAKELNISKYVFKVNIEDKYYPVIIYSNSAIYNFTLDVKSKSITYLAQGMNHTIGFSHVIIPTSLMKKPFTVYVNGCITEFNMRENASHYSIYFMHPHSSVEVKIVANWVVYEFPSILILSVITTFTALIIRLLFKGGSKH